MEQQQAIKILSALSHETRLRIVRYLVQCGKDGACAGEVAKQVGAASPRASFHLSNLVSAGVIKSKRRSRSIIYTADFDSLGGLIGFLLEDCCGGHPEIISCCAIAAR